MLRILTIAIEGPDGCGKSTVAKAIAERLQARLLRFPAEDTVTGPIIRRYLGQCQGEVRHMDAVILQSLCLVNRLEKGEEIIQAIQSGDYKFPGPQPIIVFDRYWQSGYVYGAADGLEDPLLAVLRGSMRSADLNLFLDVPPDVCARRIEARVQAGGGKRERYESEKTLSDISALYSHLWDIGPQEFPGGCWCTMPYKFLQTPDEAVKHVLETIEDMLGLKA